MMSCVLQKLLILSCFSQWDKVKVQALVTKVLTHSSFPRLGLLSSHHSSPSLHPHAHLISWHSPSKGPRSWGHDRASTNPKPYSQRSWALTELLQPQKGR